MDGQSAWQRDTDPGKCCLGVKAFNSSDFLVLVLSEIGLGSNFYSHESEHNSLIEFVSRD